PRSTGSASAGSSRCSGSGRCRTRRRLRASACSCARSRRNSVTDLRREEHYPMTDAAHQSLIRDQFTRQATPFSTAAPIASEAALQKIIDAARPGPEDTLLDIACGGGIVVCAFAPYVRHATGIAVTPPL